MRGATRGYEGVRRGAKGCEGVLEVRGGAHLSEPSRGRVHRVAHDGHELAHDETMVIDELVG